MDVWKKSPPTHTNTPQPQQAAAGREPSAEVRTPQNHTPPRLYKPPLASPSRA